jgi:hypothetical protein
MTRTHKRDEWAIDYAWEVGIWLKKLYGNHWDDKRTWIRDAALALLRNEPPPPPPTEANSRRPWRAAQNRLDTLNAIYNRHKPSR